MKNIFLSIITFGIAFFALSFTDGNTNTQGAMDNPKYVIPSDAQNVIDNSCYGCHSSDGNSTKGKMKLNFDKMQNMSTGKFVSKMSKIVKVLDKGKMPPKKYVAKHPEEALSDEQISALKTWASQSIKKYGGE